jgi:hypothetical protein
MIRFVVPHTEASRGLVQAFAGRGILGWGAPIRDAMAGVTYVVPMYHPMRNQPTVRRPGVRTRFRLTNDRSEGMIGNPVPEGGGREDLRP